MPGGVRLTAWASGADETGASWTGADEAGADETGADGAGEWVGRLAAPAECANRPAADVTAAADVAAAEAAEEEKPSGAAEAKALA
jgi:hypothetical protein